MFRNRQFISAVAAALVLSLPAADAAWALRQVVPAERRAGLEELKSSLRSAEKPLPDLPSVADALYKYSDIFTRYFGASGHAGRYAEAGWNDFLQEVRRRNPTDYSLLLHLHDPEGYLLHGDLLLHKPTGQAFLITGNPNSGKSLLAAMAVGSKASGWKRSDPDSVWEYLVNDQVLILRSAGTLLAGLPPSDNPRSLITKFPLGGALPGYSDSSKPAVGPPDFWKLGIYERRAFAPLTGLFWLNRKRAKRAKKGSRNWKDFLGTETITDSWSSVFKRRFHRLPVQELFITNPTTTQKFERKLSGMARWAKQVSAAIQRSGLEEGVVLLDPGQAGYDAIFGGGPRAAEKVVKGPLSAFFRRAQSKEQKVLIRRVPERLEEAQEWEKIGLEPLVSVEEVLNHARGNLAWPGKGLRVVQVKKGGQVMWEYVELHFSVPIPLPELAEPALRITELRLVPSKALTFASANINRFSDNRPGFLNQVTQWQAQGKVALVGIPLGLKGSESKGRFITQVLRWTRTGTPLKNLIRTEGEVVEGSRREAADRRKKGINSLAQRLTEDPADPDRNWAQTLAELRSRLEEIRRAPLGDSVIDPFLDQTEIAAISGRIEALNPEAVLRSLDSDSVQSEELLSSARVRMKEEKRDILAAIEALPSRILEEEELTRAVLLLLKEYPFLSPISKEGLFVALLKEVFLNREVRSKGWNPARVALLMEEVNRVRDFLRDRLPSFTWFPFVGVAAAKEFVRDSLGVVSFPGRPEKLWLFFHLSYGKRDALQTLHAAPFLILNKVAHKLLLDDPAIARQTQKAIVMQFPSEAFGFPEYIAKIPEVSSAMSAEGPSVLQAQVERVVHGLSDHPWIETPPLGAVPAGERSRFLALWQGWEFHSGPRWSVIDLIAFRVAQLLGGEERHPLLLEQLDDTLEAIERRVESYGSESLSDFVEKVIRAELTESEKTLVGKTISRIKKMRGGKLVGKRSIEAIVQGIFTENPSLSTELSGIKQMHDRWAFDGGDLTALASAKAILSAAPDPERSARVDRLEKKLLTDLDGYDREMSSEHIHPSVSWREVYSWIEGDYQNLYLQARLRPAAGLESPVVFVGPDALARQGGLEELLAEVPAGLSRRMAVVAGPAAAERFRKLGSAVPVFADPMDAAVYAAGIPEVSAVTVFGSGLEETRLVEYARTLNLPVRPPVSVDDLSFKEFFLLLAQGLGVPQSILRRMDRSGLEEIRRAA